MVEAIRVFLYVNDVNFFRESHNFGWDLIQVRQMLSIC